MLGMINSARVAAIIAALASIYIFTQMPKVDIPTIDISKSTEDEEIQGENIGLLIIGASEGRRLWIPSQ